MNNSIRRIVSSSIAAGLIAFTLVSAFAFGAVAPATLIGFGFLAGYGVLEIAVASYESPRFVSDRWAPEPPAAHAPPTAGIVAYSKSGDTSEDEVARAA